MSLERRRAQWDALGRTIFDVAIIGGGITGACLYHRCCAAGYRVEDPGRAVTHYQKGAADEFDAVLTGCRA